MGFFFLFLKFLVVLFFLIMFLRRTGLVWGIGLLTVTSALLLDTFLGTFGQEEMQAELGFFFYVISGALFAGAALWLWLLLRPAGRGAETVPAFRPAAGPAAPPSPTHRSPSGSGADRQMLFEQIRERLGPEDVRDLIFDLDLNENDVLAPGQEMSAAIVQLMDKAEADNKVGDLSLAVERILTPPPAENLPRVDRLTVDSPPTVIRHFLLAHYSQEQLRNMAQALDIDPEYLDGSRKQNLVRALLLYLKRRNRLDELLRLLRAGQEAPAT